MRESFPRQVDKKSRGPQGERGLEFSCLISGPGLNSPPEPRILTSFRGSATTFQNVVQQWGSHRQVCRKSQGLPWCPSRGGWHLWGHGCHLRAPGKLRGFRGQAVFLQAGFSLTPHCSPGAPICAQPWAHLAAEQSSHPGSWAEQRSYQQLEISLG